MIKFILGLIIGLFIGAFIGISIMCLLQVAKEEDTQ